uniref:(California timema) hypothetical protein n=1 Tax=Timema californicum TaxID=61474 RepID=A0A7R9JM61_TIMCA|nr:unnamed protein product [Timema californicum]
MFIFPQTSMICGWVVAGTMTIGIGPTPGRSSRMWAGSLFGLITSLVPIMTASTCIVGPKNRQCSLWKDSATRHMGLSVRKH